ncbi:MAG: RNA polymerase sigma factor RpoE [Gammaproteobacteria bacterium 28-57-27]|nr:MAG: RNA polymerase sigma factor RpoE [Gammaproteobacteria bacterium 28-57-27]
MSVRPKGQEPGRIPSPRLDASASDQQLVELAKAGDPYAFELLLRKYQHKVSKLIMRYVRDMDEALDLTQETFVKAWKALPAFRGESAFYTWLYRIAVNTAKNYLSTAYHQARMVDLDADETDQYADTPGLVTRDTPETVMNGEELHRVLKKALSELPEDLRSAITLREFEGLSYEEIAEVMDCPIGTVRSRIFRAREAIDKHLQAFMV